MKPYTRAELITAIELHAANHAPPNPPHRWVMQTLVSDGWVQLTDIENQCLRDILARLDTVFDSPTAVS